MFKKLTSIPPPALTLHDNLTFALSIRFRTPHLQIIIAQPSSSIACEASGFTVWIKGKSLTSAEFGDFASYSLQLFSMWSRVFSFVCISPGFYLN